jgi:HEPN domain-containing protein
MAIVQETLFVNDFASRSFRDVADQDYIAARRSYRDGLTQPFLWSSLQCVEKYLKAILLFNGKSARGIGHDLGWALDRVTNIKDLTFTIPRECTSFIRFLSEVGADRYFSAPLRILPGALLSLDRTVWHVRLYCYFMRGTIARRDGTKVNLFPLELRRVHDPTLPDHPEGFRIQTGYLEKVIGGRAKGYDSLVWKNFFYGKRRKLRIKNLPDRISWASPTHAIHPEAFEAISRLVDFPREVAARFTPAKLKPAELTPA